MPTTHLSPDLSGDELIRAVEQLSPPEFERFVTRVLALRADRGSPRLSAPEANLLQRINTGLPAHSRQRYEVLIAHRDARTLSEQDHDELCRLTDEAEALEAARVAALAELAAHRGVTLTALLTDLGLPAHNHG